MYCLIVFRLNDDLRYAPPQFSIEMELKHEHFEAVMVKSLSPLTFLLTNKFTSVFQQKVSFFKWNGGEDAST